MSAFFRFMKYGIILIFSIIGVLYFFEPFGDIKIQAVPYVCGKTVPDELEISEKKYLTTARYSGRLGNMIYRCASLYGIGKSLGRYPYLSDETPIFTELTTIFPLLSDYFLIKSSNNKSQEKEVKFGSNDCCKFESPQALKKYNNVKFLKLSSIYLQSFKFFQDYDKDIKKLFECSQDLKKQIEIKANEIWKDDFKSHKICAHIRRSDSVKIPSLQETTYEFLHPSLTFIYENLQMQSKTNVSLLLFGDDEAFAKNLTFSNMFTSTTILVNNTRGYDMCLAIEYCDTFILSAASSSFGWWIGYLMKSQGTVYYNAEISKRKSDGKVVYAADTFPPHWKKIKVLNNMTVIVE